MIVIQKKMTSGFSINVKSNLIIINVTGFLFYSSTKTLEGSIIEIFNLEKAFLSIYYSTSLEALNDYQKIKSF
jgi:hypothetical protein